jgi:acyl carrier protein
MTYQEIQEKLTGVMRSVFEAPAGLVLGDSTKASDVEGWDSLAHVALIVAVEKAFSVRFTTKEVKALTNVGDFIRLIERRVK